MSIAVKCAGVSVDVITDWRPLFKGATVQTAVILQYILIDCNVFRQLCTCVCVCCDRITTIIGQRTVYQPRKPVKFPGICDLVRVFFCTIASCWWCCRNRPCSHGCQHHCRTHTAGIIPIFTAHRATRIGFFLCAFCFTDTLCFFRYLCVADFTYKVAGCACCCGNIPTGFVMFVFTVQFLCDAAAFLTAHMTADWFRAFLAVALCRMLMDTVRYQSIAILRVFMTARRFCRPFAVAASVVMLGVMFAQPTYGNRIACIRHGRHQRHQHTQADKRRKDSFSHGFLLPLSPSNSVSNNTNPFRPLFLDISSFSE